MRNQIDSLIAKWVNLWKLKEKMLNSLPKDRFRYYIDPVRHLPNCPTNFYIYPNEN